MSSLSRRLDKLHAKIAPLTPDDGRPTLEAITERIHENLAAIVETMAPEHVAHIGQECARYSENSLDFSDLSPFMRELARIVHWHSGASWPSYPDFPLAMPPEVARVWLEEPDVSAIDRCNACHFPLPARSEFLSGERGFRPAVSYFHVCPVCGSDDLRRIEDSQGVLWSGRDGCSYRAGRRLDRSQVVNGRAISDPVPREKGT